MGLSAWQILLVLVLFLLFFGRGRIPALMSDLAAGIKSFKKGMKDEDGAAGADQPVETALPPKEEKSPPGTEHREAREQPRV